MSRFLVAAAAGAVLLCGVIQAASDGMYSGSAAALSLPAHLPGDLGIAIYARFERFIPLQFVEQVLAQDALRRGDLQASALYAGGIRASDVRNDYLAHIAQRAGDRNRALTLFLAGADVDAVSAESQRLRRAGNLTAALVIEEQLRTRLQETGTHPNAVAESYWRSGVMKTQLANRTPVTALNWYRAAEGDYWSAAHLAPFSTKFLLAAGVLSMKLHHVNQARAAFAQTVADDPASTDGYAGLGLIALAQGERAAALRWESRAAQTGTSPLLKQLRAALQ